MEYYIKNDKIILKFLANNNGKFRFKKRNNRIDFGKTFSTRAEKFTKETYLEWQIGYDVPINEITNKKTSLTTKSFIGSNGKNKYPYELSEILFEAIKIGYINKNEVNILYNKIEDYKNFIDENPITVEHNSKIILNDIEFEETSIKLPTFYVFCIDNTQIEVSIQKQQYATGVQPMIYYCIPFYSFNNYKFLDNNSSIVGDFLEFEINNENKDNLLLLMKIFGMASKRHQHDILEILKILINLY